MKGGGGTKNLGRNVLNVYNVNMGKLADIDNL